MNAFATVSHASTSTIPTTPPAMACGEPFSTTTVADAPK